MQTGNDNRQTEPRPLDDAGNPAATSPSLSPSREPVAGSRARDAGRAVTHGRRDQPKVAITLDADFSPQALAHVREGRYGRQVNDHAVGLIERERVPITVFVTGMWAQQYPADLARLAANPQVEIANHTWNHRAWTGNCYGLPRVTSAAEKRREVRRTNDWLRTRTGRAPRYFRFPGLCHSGADLKIIASQGLRTVDTDVPTSDAFATDARRTARDMLAATRPGSILLLHLNGAPNAPATARILRLLVDGLRERGLQPVTLSDLLGP